MRTRLGAAAAHGVSVTCDELVPAQRYLLAKLEVNEKAKQSTKAHGGPSRLLLVLLLLCIWVGTRVGLLCRKTLSSAKDH